MKRSRITYSIIQKTSTIFMMAALLWLTISLPFVYAGQQEIAQQQQKDNTDSPFTGNEEESANPFGNSTEEKAPSNNSFSEEYLHDHHKEDGLLAVSKQYRSCENARNYIAFHGELLVPPPNCA
ncbi:hypothetical protein WG954_06575 [Lacibacter sp. H375]|uniref:hypothetical protein n=1 Tax=Lacibacter sp. H375 TaxID=3133424 RepID=UPI0030BB229C